MVGDNMHTLASKHRKIALFLVRGVKVFIYFECVPLMHIQLCNLL